MMTYSKADATTDIINTLTCTHYYNTCKIKPVTIKYVCPAPHLSHLLTHNEKTTDQGPLSVSEQQLYELGKQEE